METSGNLWKSMEISKTIEMWNYSNRRRVWIWYSKRAQKIRNESYTRLRV